MHIQPLPGEQAHIIGNKSLLVTHLHMDSIVPTIIQNQCSHDLGTDSNTQIRTIVPLTLLPWEFCLNQELIQATIKPHKLVISINESAVLGQH